MRATSTCVSSEISIAAATLFPFGAAVDLSRFSCAAVNAIPDDGNDTRQHEYPSTGKYRNFHWTSGMAVPADVNTLTRLDLGLTRDSRLRVESKLMPRRVAARPDRPGPLGRNIAHLRERGGHTNAAAFARLIGVLPSKLNDWEAGVYTGLRLDSLLRISKGIPCRVEDLLEGVDEDYDRIVSGLDTLQNSEPSNANTVDSVKPLSGKSGVHKPDRVYTPHPLGEGSHVDRFGGTAEGPPTSRHQPGLRERAELAATLTEYADALKRADDIRRNLYDAAAALFDDKGGDAGRARTGQDPRAGGAGGRVSRKGKR